MCLAYFHAPYHDEKWHKELGKVSFGWQLTCGPHGGSNTVQIVVQMPHVGNDNRLAAPSTAVINNCQLRHASKLPFPPNLDVGSLLIQ